MRASWVLLLICLCPLTRAEDSIGVVECSSAGNIIVNFASDIQGAVSSSYVRDCTASALFPGTLFTEDPPGTYRVEITDGATPNDATYSCGEDTPDAAAARAAGATWSKTVHIVVPKVSTLISGEDVTFEVKCEYKDEFEKDFTLDHDVSTLTPMFTTEIPVLNPVLEATLLCLNGQNANSPVSVGDDCTIKVDMTNNRNGYWTEMVMMYVHADKVTPVVIAQTIGAPGAIELYDNEGGEDCVPADYSSLHLLEKSGVGVVSGTNAVEYDFHAFLFKDGTGAVYFKVGVKVCSYAGDCSISCEYTAGRRKRSAEDFDRSVARVERSAEEDDEVLPTESNAELEVMLVIGATPENLETEEATIEPVLITDDVCLSKDAATTILVCVLLLLVGAAFGGPLFTSLRMRRNLAASVGKTLPFTGLSSPAVAVWSSKSACDPHNVLVHHDELSASLKK